MRAAREGTEAHGGGGVGGASEGGRGRAAGTAAHGGGDGGDGGGGEGEGAGGHLCLLRTRGEVAGRGAKRGSERREGWGRERQRRERAAAVAVCYSSTCKNLTSIFFDKHI